MPCFRASHPLVFQSVAFASGFLGSLLGARATPCLCTRALSLSVAVLHPLHECVPVCYASHCCWMFRVFLAWGCCERSFGGPLRRGRVCRGVFGGRVHPCLCLQSQEGNWGPPGEGSVQPEERQPGSSSGWLHPPACEARPTPPHRLILHPSASSCTPPACPALATPFSCAGTP